MASLRKHPRSPFWFLRKRELDTGRWFEQSTGLRWDDQFETRKAQRLAEQAATVEKNIGTPKSSPAFLAWVPQYLLTHFKSENSRRRYQVAWQAIKMFLAQRDIVYPRQVRYAHGSDYLAWRMATEVHGRKVKHNSALVELKFLSQLMNEAIRRELCEANPLLRLGIARQPHKVKPELTDKEIETLRRALAKQPSWARIAFEISLYTGCRFSECEIPMTDVDLVAGSIRIRDAKRGEIDPRKFFTVPIHPRLRPTLENLQRNGAEKTCSLTRDKNGRINAVFRSSGVEASFHSLRVTFVTRCHRGGLSEAQAMRLVNHSSQLVHRIYSRLNVEDVREAQTQIPLP